MKEKIFHCGCRFEIKNEELDFDLSKINEFCPKTWELFASGRTKGIWQLESSIGKTWSKKLRPETIGHLAALTAILRPGCLNAIDDNGVSMTKHYCLRKNKEEEQFEYQKDYDAILKDTFGVLIYQEQALKISKELAGFTLSEADSLRKSLGKKLASEMAKSQKLFVEKAKEKGILSEEQTSEIFDWIKEGQRYSFNKSHAVCYGIMAYITAYIKSHFPLAFFCSWMTHSQEKQDPKQEVFELVNDAKLFDIEICVPNYKHLEKDFYINNGKIYFGLYAINKIGDSVLEKIVNISKYVEQERGVPISSWDWYDYLIFCSTKRVDKETIGTTANINMIKAGCFDWSGKDRQLMIEEFSIVNEMTENEIEIFRKKYNVEKTFLENLDILHIVKKNGGITSSITRERKLFDYINVLKNPPSSLKDSPVWISYSEKEMLGISITYSKIDSCDISSVNTTCKECFNGKNDGLLLLGIEIQKCNQYKTKKGKTPGQTMAFLTVSDSSGMIDNIVCFPDVYKQYSNLLQEKNTLIIRLEKPNSKDNDSFILCEAWQV